MVSHDSPIVVGIFYPTEWFGSQDAFAAAVDELRAVDPRIDVVIERYDESHAIRSARGKGNDDALRSQVPPLTDSQRAAFARVEIAQAIDLPFDVGEVAPRLKWVQAVGAGTGQLQSAGITEAGIVLTSNAGSNSVAIAEFVVGRLLQAWKRFREIEAAQQAHRWDSLYGEEIAGRTVGFIGLGAINEAVAARLRGFDLRILATRRSGGAGATAPNVDHVYPPAELFTMLGQCDAVVAAVPGTAETTGMMNADAFAAMRPGSIFCNVGRGSLVDEPALIAALKSGHLRAALLDVASEEPLPPDNPLWDAPNVYLSAHCSSAPEALFRNLHRRFVANLQRYLNGEPLQNIVDVSRGY